MIKKISIFIIAVFIILFTVQNSYSAQLFNYQKNNIYMGKVIRVIDGDTIIFKPIDNNNIEYEDERIRLIGVDTPETVHPYKKEEYYGREASTFTKMLLNKDTTIYIQTESKIRDNYGRLLGYIWLKEPVNIYQEEEIAFNMLNAILILNGYGKVLAIKPNITYIEYFKRLEDHAKKNNAGLWNKK